MNFARPVVLLVPTFWLSLCVATAAETRPPAGSEEQSTFTALHEEAVLGKGDAQYKLGLAYIEGRGVAVDPVEGFVWLRLAAEKGVTGKALHVVLESLNADQLTAARQRLATIRAGNPSLNPKAPGTAQPSPSDTPRTPESKAVESVSSPAPSDAQAAVNPAPTSPPSSNGRERPREPDAESELSLKRADLEREYADRLAAAEEALRNATADLARRNAENADLVKGMQVLGTELRDTRSELASVRENLAVASARAARSESQASEIAGLKKALLSANGELEAAKVALAAASSKAQSVTTVAPVAAESGLVDSLRNEVSILKRDLQSATNGLRRAAADKAALEAALFSANQQLAKANNELPTLRRRIAEADRNFASGGDPIVVSLRGELNEARFRLGTAEKQIRARDEELDRLRTILAAADARSAPSASEIAAAQRAAKEAQHQLTVATGELANLRAQVASGHELESRLRQLEAEKANAQTGKPAEEVALIAAAHAAAEEKLSAALKSLADVSNERDHLRARAAVASALEARVRELELEKGSAPDKDEFARVVSAKNDVENKLSTALRSYTLVARERDELRARFAQLSPSSFDDKGVDAANAPAKPPSPAAAQRRTNAR